MALEGPYINQVEGIAIAQNVVNSSFLKEEIDQLSEQFEEQKETTDQALSDIQILAYAGIILGGAGSTPPVITPLLDYEVNLPQTLFVPYNDINVRRQIGISLYLDNLIAERQNVLLNNAHTVRINNSSSGLKLTGIGYVEKSLGHDRVVTNASVAIGKKIALSTLFDSKSASIVTDRYGLEASTWIYAAKTQENFIKDNIDNGGGISRPILVGSKSFKQRTSTYKTTNDVVTRGGTFAIGGWCVANFLRHAMQLNGRQNYETLPQVSYYLLGLHTTTGVDWNGSDGQVELIRTTVQGKNPPDYNSAVWDYLKSKSGWSGFDGDWVDTPTNRNTINAWLMQKYANPDNPFFSLEKAQSVGSTNAFSYQKALDRYKTLSDDDFSTRLIVGNTAGSLVTNATSYDVCTPTHIVLEGGQNDNGRFIVTPSQILTDIITIKDIIRSELPNVKIGIMDFVTQGVIYPEAYQKVDSRLRGTAGNYFKFQLSNQFKTTLGSRNTQIANNVYYLPAYNCMIPYSSTGDTVGYDEAGEFLISGSDTIHPGLITHNSIGDVVYAWILSTI